ncbi:MAG: hypothetical protein ACTHM6_07910 [Tepidisphaeraceae bacterium]
MKALTKGIAATMLFALAAVGCESTHQEGVKSDLRTQWTTVYADTETTTSAAKQVLMDNKLTDVSSQSTKMDGMASGVKADGTKIQCAIQKTDNGSQLSVTVGRIGSPKEGAELAAAIKQKAEGMAGTDKKGM